VGIDLDASYRPLRGVDNNFWQDRNAMKAGNFTGITGFPNQDIAMWVTMGPIADRTNDRLGASDLAVVEFRKQMVAAVRDFVDGKPAIGTGDLAVPAKVCSFQAIVPKTVDWKAYDVKPVWETPGPVLEPSYNVQESK
jgi:phthalate 4,5-dioxygenase